MFFGEIFFNCVMIMMAGLAELTFTIVRLPIYYKEKELFLYPAWAFTIPMFVMRLPWTFLEAAVWECITYFLIGFTSSAGR
jgi:hypothetical protein